MKAILQITMTSSTCRRYMLVDANGKRLWSNRVEPSERGDLGARSRMAVWALANGVRIVERQPARFAAIRAR